jgi:hypothetical protein
MSEYAVNKQTGEVLKRDQSGAWQKVKSAKNAEGAILINEGGGWGPVPSKSAQPTSPFLQRGMDMVQGAQATSQAAQGANQYLADTVDAPRERAGIESAGDAFLFNVGNVLTAGGMQRAGNQVVPGKELGDTAMREAEVNYPMASVVGRGVGYAAPASQGGRVASMATQDLITATGARALAPKALSEGTGAAARGARYLGRLGTLAPVGAAQVGLYEGLVEQPVRDFMAGEEGTIGGRVQAGVNALANPLNYGVLPAASLVGRVGKSVLTGVATPGDVQRAVSAGSRGAVPLSEGQLAADAAQILDTQAMNAIDPRGFKLVERILRQSGVADRDVPAVNAKVREILEAAPDAVAGRLTVGQVYAKALYDLDKTQASENILKVLRERRNVTDVKDRSPSIVGNEVRDLRSSQVDFVTQSAESNLGAGRRIDIKNAVADTKKQIGTEYERVLAEADSTRPEAPALASIVIGDASKGILARRAKNAGFEDVDAYAAARPDEAAHWLRSHLDKAARSAQGRERVDLENTVSQLDELLDTNPGYAQARQQYGTESGVDRARDIGSNFIAAARNQGSLDLLLEQIAALPARERDVALLAIRDNLLSPVRGSGEDAPARISQLISVGTLEGIERLGPAGKNLADDLRAIRDENAFLGQIDSGNPLRQSATFSNADAQANAPDLYSGGVARAMNAGGGSSLPADIAVSAITGTPIAPFTMAKIARSGLQSIFAPSRQSKEAMTQFLMSRPRNALGGQTAPPSGGPDIMPTAGIATGAERAAEASPNALSPQGPIRAAGFGGGRLPDGTITRSAVGTVGGGAYGSFNDVNGDGVIDERDVQAGATLGATLGATSAAARRVSTRLLGSGRLASDVTRRGGKEYSFPLEQGKSKAKVVFEPDDEGRGTLVSMDFEGAVEPTAREIHDAFQKTFRAMEDHAVRFQKPVYMFGVTGRGQERTYLRALQKNGPPEGYQAFYSERFSEFYVVKNDNVAKFLRQIGDNFGSDVRFVSKGQSALKGTGKGFGPVEAQKAISDALPTLRGDLGNALAGAGIGAAGPAESNEERLRNMAVGAGIGFGARRFGKAFGAEADDVATAGVGGKRPPKPDSPEAIKAALRDMAKAKPEPTRLEQMVDAGKDAAVPPAKSGVAEEDKLAAQATRMLERGEDVFKIHDQTGVVMIPYNNSNVPLYAPDIGPEEVIRTFYTWLQEPAIKRPEWVNEAVRQAKRKSRLLLTDRNIAPPDMVPQPPANALANLPPERFPVGAVVGGALGGAATGIAGGVAAIGGYQAYKDEQRKRNALSGQ